MPSPPSNPQRVPESGPGVAPEIVVTADDLTTSATVATGSEVTTSLTVITGSEEQLQSEARGIQNPSQAERLEEGGLSKTAK